MFVILFGLTCQNIHASEQFLDLLLYNGINFEIGVFPMESYFALYPVRRPLIINWNSALIRGYRARYEIINNELILINLERMRYNGDWKKIFNWHLLYRKRVRTFSGNINLIAGKGTGVYLGFTPVFENYIILEIYEGIVQRVYNANSSEYIEILIQSHPTESEEHKYFTNKLYELHEQNN